MGATLGAMGRPVLGWMELEDKIFEGEGVRCCLLYFGLVKPDDADAKVRFLAAEALRGVGGIIPNREGERFVNELGHRDRITGETRKRLLENDLQAQARARQALADRAADSLKKTSEEQTRARGAIRERRNADVQRIQGAVVETVP